MGFSIYWTCLERLKKNTVCWIALISYIVAESPGDALVSGVSDVLLLKAIANCGGEEIDLKVKFMIFLFKVKKID